MAHYLVGTKGFLKKEVWEFSQALEVANDGDVIELENGICPFFEKADSFITIRKNLTIEGNLAQNEEGVITTNVIGRVIVKGGATVTLRNLEIRTDYDKRNNLVVGEGATVIMEDCVISSYANEGENYPVIHVSENSQVQLNRVQVCPGNIHDRKYQIYVRDSSMQIVDSVISARIYTVNARVVCQNSIVSYPEANAIFASGNSEVELTESTFEGGAKAGDNKWSCVKVVDSQLWLNNVNILQPQYDSALETVNSKAQINFGFYDSMKFANSEVTIGIVDIMESLAICSGSSVKAENIFIHGRENGKINLWCSEGTSLAAERIYFGILSIPNIKLERHIDFQVDEMAQLEYDSQEEEFVVDENDSVIVAGDVPAIEYYGELTALERLNQMVGIQSAKETAEEFIAIAQMNKKREAMGYANTAFSLHSLFLGNPGTGKTTVARLLGEILYEKGVISSKIFVETSRSDLVGQYIGHTAKKTREVLESALGGVLFIDEAYTLWKGADDTKDFGLEAINEILKFMEDHRQDIVIIFAGYTHSMEKFLQSNEGLKSRIPNTFMFEDYTEEELVQIGLGDLKKQNYQIDEEAYSRLVYQNFAKSDDKSNGRWVRNLNEQLIRKMAVRAVRDPEADLTLITQEDIEAVAL